MSTTAYRSEIDGLRALAVVPVVLFHAGVDGFDGGFVGVDVFFVISGYLITKIVAAEVDAGKFSLLGFYERRVRRIFPALIAMLAAAAIAGYVLLLPDDYKLFSRSALAALVSISNYTFYKQAGYFDEVAIVKPLLHTWSLAVEEQFYLFLPLLLVVLARWRYRSWAIAAIAAGSLAIALDKTPGHPDFAFYLLPARAWELLAGSLLALNLVPRVSSRLACEALSMAGIAMIAAAVFAYTPDTPFPGPGAILPVLGAVLVIHCAHGTRSADVLGSALPRGIGLISYSLYLWHWPIIVFVSYYTQAPLSPGQATGAIVASLLVGTLSWRYIEQPFRGQNGPRGWPLWRAAIGSSIVLASGLAVVNLSAGARWRMPSGVEALSKAQNKSDFNRLCVLVDKEERKASDLRCLLGPPAIEPRLAVWADSHGQELAVALQKMHPLDRSLLVMAQGGCPPSLDPEVYKKPTCAPHNRAVLDFLKASPSIDTVLLAVYFLSPRYAVDDGFAAGVLDAVRALRDAGKRVILVGPVPKPDFDVARKLQLALALGMAAPPGIDRRQFERESAETFELLKRAEGMGAEIVHPETSLCDTETCRITSNDKPLYVDDNHLSLAGAELVIPSIEALIVRPAEAPSPGS